VSKAISHRIGLGRFRGDQGSGGGFRCLKLSVNGGLMAFLRGMSRAVARVSGKGACYD
jgi:hypothetical protein